MSIGDRPWGLLSRVGTRRSKVDELLCRPLGRNGTFPFVALPAALTFLSMLLLVTVGDGVARSILVLAGEGVGGSSNLIGLLQLAGILARFFFMDDMAFRLIGDATGRGSPRADSEPPP